VLNIVTSCPFSSKAFFMSSNGSSTAILAIYKYLHSK
jgi:hypothetical protein